MCRSYGKEAIQTAIAGERATRRAGPVGFKGWQAPCREVREKWQSGSPGGPTAHRPTRRPQRICGGKLETVGQHSQTGHRWRAGFPVVGGRTPSIGRQPDPSTLPSPTSPMGDGEAKSGENRDLVLTGPLRIFRRFVSPRVHPNDSPSVALAQIQRLAATLYCAFKAHFTMCNHRAWVLSISRSLLF